MYVCVSSFVQFSCVFDFLNDDHSKESFSHPIERLFPKWLLNRLVVGFGCIWQQFIYGELIAFNLLKSLHSASRLRYCISTDSTDS